MNIIGKEKINKGWSSDIKYCITDENSNKYLLRISSIEQYDKKLNEYKFMQECANLGVNMCKPIEFGTCEEGVYSIQTWIEGIDAEEYIPKLNSLEQYQYGIKAGKELKKIHSISAPTDTLDWEMRFNRKIDNKIKMYNKCPFKFDKGHLFIDFINENRNLLKNRPNVYQHGDYHIGNMMINNEGELVIIDFNRADFGDPWEEFNRIVWCAQISPMFASGIVDGYFLGDIPNDFWKLLALYTSTNSLSSIPWAISFGNAEIVKMINQAEDILKWYNDMTTYIPSWYKNYYAKRIEVNEDIKLVKYYPNYNTALNWYLDKDVCKQVDNIDFLYDLDRLKWMYNYLNKNGYLFYIKYKNKLCGDVCLQYNGDIAIVISKSFQNKHIGRKVIETIITFAKEKGIFKLHVGIYSFNTQSKKMFESVGFEAIDNENYILNIG